MSDEKETPCLHGDELWAGPQLEGGVRPFVRHTADHQIQVGLMSQAEEVQLPEEGALHFEQIPGTNRFKIEPILGSGCLGTKGPAKVNSVQFRNNWDGIFGNKTVVGSA